MRYHNVSTRYELKLAKLTAGNIFLLVALDTTEQRCETEDQLDGLRSNP